jgi:hypothetical protein
MESFESNYKPSQPEPSSAIHVLVDTDTNLRTLEAAVCGSRRRKGALFLELKKPGIAADKERLRELLTELDRIARALRGWGTADQLSRRNAHPEGLAGDEHIGTIVPRVMAELAAERHARTVEQAREVL